MKALSVLRDARAAGIEFDVVGEDVRLTAQREPPQELVEALRRHKAEIVALLSETSEPAEARPALDDGEAWRRRLRSHRDRLVRLGYAAEVASPLACGQVLNEMHRALTVTNSADLTVCAGCNQTLTGLALDTGDGRRVHNHGDHKCLVAYEGKRSKFNSF